MGSMGSKLSLRRSQELVVSNPLPPPITRENDLSTSVAFGKPFLLRWEPFKKHFFESLLSDSQQTPKSARFWSASEQSRECLISEVNPTSLLTFHAPNADAVNVRGNAVPLISVDNDAHVSIYANVGSGRYLTLGGIGLRFTSSPSEVRSDAEIALLCEFIIRRVSRSMVGAPLRFGEAVYLECASSPGTFLSVRFVDRRWKLTTTTQAKDRCKFILHSPTLRDLVQLHAASPQPATTLFPEEHDQPVNDFELEESRIEAERERAFMQEIARNLPIDIAKKIFEFKPDWIRTARLTCKAWQMAAERSIRRIRVNGEFCSLETPEERAHLVDFVRRCPNLEVLTLRNVMTLDDDDVAKITENRNLVRLILGGCRRLSDKSTAEIAEKLSKLNHLNMAFTSITDESLRIVSERVYHLKELNLYNCSGVTVDGINRTVHGLHSLEHINLRGTVVDSHHVQTFRRKRPDVVVLTGPASADSIWG